MKSNSYDLETVILELSAANARARNGVAACVSDIKSGVKTADARIHRQQVADVFSELVDLDAKLRVALVHTMASMVGMAGLVPIETEGERLVSAAKDAQDSAAESMAAFSEKYLGQLPGGAPKQEPRPLLSRLQCSLESLEDLQRALDDGNFFLFPGGTTEGFDWALHTMDCVRAFTRVRR